MADAIREIAIYGGDTVELVDVILNPKKQEQVSEDIISAIRESGLEVSAYSIFADLLVETPEQYETEISRVMRQVDLAHKLGAGIMRSDFTQWGRSPEKNTAACFEHDLPRLIDACRRIADYAARYGIVITVENHGTYINGSERIARLILSVNRDNFRCTLDIGNSLCVDEDPAVCIKNLLPYAATIHFKDFYIRKHSISLSSSDSPFYQVAGWITSNYGNYLRGAIIGHGDMDVIGIMKYIKNNGYDSTVTIEYEGMEECRLAAKTGLNYLKKHLSAL